MGRPEIPVDQVMLDKVERFAGQGLAEYQIATMIGMSHDTFIKKKRKFPELLESLKRGKAAGVATISNALFGKAEEGDNIAMIFYLCNRDPENWQRHDKPPESDAIPATPVNVTIKVADGSTGGG